MRKGSNPMPTAPRKGLVGFIGRTAKEWKKTERALRDLGYGAALDHDTALLKTMGRPR